MIVRQLGRVLARPWAIALLVALAAPSVYAWVRNAAGQLGYDMFPMWVNFPNTFELLWVVAPGAALAAVLLDWTLGPYREGTLLRRLGAGVVLGGVLGWANAPLSVLLALALHALMGAPQSFLALVGIWIQSLPPMLALAFPVAVPCGAFLGFAVATLGALEVHPGSERTHDDA